ncbi:hypothetical protein I7V30_06275 [Lelliottia amnigena]|uniref:putative phage abortive infection protein n=1 Tax=Lelliottia amnigena TaxID=61646 RepID=UPI00192BA988|nr:putative phage abortive infection protein [Lelliottia amnigena]MBL5964876.1 hypothetical protein [Lelliottia amnigena]
MFPIRKPLVLLIVSALVLTFALISNELGFYSYLNSNWNWDKAVALASALGAVVAAIATWLAANRAADGAEIARQSMVASELAAKATLQETQLFNLRTGFENRYALLLAQHDQYHRQLCEYIDCEQKLHDKLPKKPSSYPVVRFFDDVSDSHDLKSTLAFLTGHEIISRYMRTLYHLLKFVHDDFYLNQSNCIVEEKKKYTSPVRSVIRNDVLLMIALNALNVVSERSKKTGYPKYQKLLHTFDFFEHAIFTHHSEPNTIFNSDDWTLLIYNKIKITQSEYDDAWRKNSQAKIFEFPALRLFSPLMLCLLIYQNPIKTATEDALGSFFCYLIKTSLQDKLEGIIKSYQKSKKYVDSYCELFFRQSESEEWMPIEDAVLEKIRSEVNVRGTNSYHSFFFQIRAEGEGEGKWESIEGRVIYGHFETVLRYEKLYGDIIEKGGLIPYLEFLRQKYLDELNELNKVVFAHYTNNL